MNIIGIIPSRYNSKRFPGKALVDIAGKTMVHRVYEQASKAGSLSKVLVATDDQKIFDHVRSFGGEVMMTSSAHTNGTERCGEVIDKYTSTFDVIINVQGDTPFIHPEQIDQLAECFQSFDTEIATIVSEIHNPADLSNPNVVKVIFNDKMRAIYFSRSPIPYLAGFDESQWLQHQTYFKHGHLYGFRKDILKKVIGLPASPLERSESLEQLRWIENGIDIQIAVTGHESIGIDSPEDLQNIPKDID